MSWLCPAKCFQMLVLEGYQKFYFLCCHTCEYTFGHRFFLSKRFFLCLFFLCQAELFTSLRNCSVKTLSWFTEWINWNKSSVFEASALKCMVSWYSSFSAVHDSNQWCSLILADFCEASHHLSDCRIPFSFRCAKKSSIPFNFILEFAYALTFSEFEKQSPSFLFLNQYRWTSTWRWCDMWISQVQCSVLASHSGFFWIISNDVNRERIFHSNSVASPSIPSNSPWKKILNKSSTWPSHFVSASF